MILLLDTRNDRHYVGDNSLDLARATGRVTFNVDTRTCVIQHSSRPDLVVNPTSHTLSYGDSWAVDDMLVDMARDAIGYLCRNCGFLKFTST